LVEALLPEAVNDLKANRERAPETRRFLAVLAARTHQLDAAEQLYRKCLDRVEKTPNAEAEIYGGLLEVLWEGRKLDEIVRVCRQGVKTAQATNLVLFHVNLAQALIQQGQNDEALTAAAAAVQLADDKNRLRLRRIRVDILRQAGQHAAAIDECRVLLKEHTQPGEVRDIRYSLSNTYTAAREYAKAEEQLRRILEADPNDVTVNNDLGYVLADQGRNLDEAEKLIRKAIALDLEDKKRGKLGADDEPDQANAAYLDSLGWVLFRRGQLDEARQWLEKAAKASEGKDDPVIWDHLGDVYFKLDQPARAQATWKKALDLYEVEKRRKADDHYQELKNKLKLLQP
jgi:tetratricopeptide (TPR) repeat protein